MADPASLFHIALAEEWEPARESGWYVRSTVGLSLDEVVEVSTIARG